MPVMLVYTLTLAPVPSPAQRERENDFEELRPSSSHHSAVHLRTAHDGKSGQGVRDMVDYGQPPFCSTYSTSRTLSPSFVSGICCRPSMISEKRCVSL